MPCRLSWCSPMQWPELTRFGYRMTAAVEPQTRSCLFTYHDHHKNLQIDDVALKLDLPCIVSSPRNLMVFPCSDDQRSCLHFQRSPHFGMWSRSCGVFNVLFRIRLSKSRCTFALTWQRCRLLKLCYGVRGIHLLRATVRIRGVPGATNGCSC